MDAKQRAAQAAVEYVNSGMVVGLGTGSTADYFLIALAEALKSGRLHDVRGVPTSSQSERRARELGIPVSTLAECPVVDVTIDGADEVAPNLDLIKGLGGALLREKIVAQSSKQMVIIADEGKVVARLGTQSPLPVEVIQFAHDVQAAYLKTLGAEPVLRVKEGMTFVTDNGNYIYDCRFPQGIADPADLERALHRRAGIVEDGLFLGLASVAIIGSQAATREIRRAP